MLQYIFTERDLPSGGNGQNCHGNNAKMHYSQGQSNSGRRIYIFRCEKITIFLNASEDGIEKV
jgi:hypothetical protein